MASVASRFGKGDGRQFPKLASISGCKPSKVNKTIPRGYFGDARVLARPRQRPMGRVEPQFGEHCRRPTERLHAAKMKCSFSRASGYAGRRCLADQPVSLVGI
jgi:hypothetical protein